MSLRKRPTLTPALLAANRRNAQKSTGPRTEEGKRRVMLNGLKHGLRSRSFRQSLIKSGEGTGLVDRNFLLGILNLLPQTRQEVRGIARLVRVHWSVTHWTRCHKIRPVKPEQRFKNRLTDFQLMGRLLAAEELIAPLKERRKKPTRPEGDSESAMSPGVLSPAQMDLRRRTGLILLARVVPLELLNWPRHVKDWIRRNEPPNQESCFESTRFKIAPGDPSRIQNRDLKRQTGYGAGFSTTKAREAGQGARPTDKSRPPKPECHPESATSKIVPGDRSRIQDRDSRAQAMEIARSIIAKAMKRIPDRAPIQQPILPHESCTETAEQRLKQILEEAKRSDGSELDFSIANVLRNAW
jgi:hypothetical protein